MQSLSHPGLVCLSAAARDYVHRDFPVLFEDLGPQRVKNLDTPIHCYLVRPNNAPVARSIPPIHRRNEANLVRRCHDLLRKALLEVTAPEELEPVEAAVLASLLDAPGADANVLSSRAGVDVGDVRRYFKHLAKLGLVEPHTKAGRKQDSTWRITPRGIDLLQRSLPGILAAIDRVLAPLSNGERETLLNLLARVIQANDAKD
jgi:DNA-binding MarR family transcriptional regulator